MPDPLDSLCDTDIIGLELVETHANQDRGTLQSPHQELPYTGHTVLGDVVDDD